MVPSVSMVACLALASVACATSSPCFEASHEGRSARRRRHLVFPRGSSMTFVFAYATYFDFNVNGISDVATELTLAYPLPNKPLKFPPKHAEKAPNSEAHHYYDIKHHTEGIHGHIHDYQENILEKPLHRSSFRVNSRKEEQLREKTMHRNSWNTYNDEFYGPNSKSNGFKTKTISRYHRHAEDRIDFQREVASILNMKGIDGEACILRARCEIARNAGEQSPNLLQALMRLVFMKPSYRNVSASEEQFFKECDSGKRCPFSLLEAELPIR